MPIFIVKSITIRPLNAEELAVLRGFQKEKDKINPKPEKEINPKPEKEINPKPEKENKSKEDRYYIPRGDVPCQKVYFSKAALNRLASILLSADVPFAEVEKFLYTLPISVKDQLVPLLFEEYHRRCAKG